MTDPVITFATRWRYDTKFLMNGTVKVEGFDFQSSDYKGPGGLTGFMRDMVTDLSFDVGEQALAHYIIARGQGVPVTAIPVFPSRFFPHFGVSVSRTSGIESPRDLVGKRVAVPDWGFNPAVWMRSILIHQYEVPIDQIQWVFNAEKPCFGRLDYPHSRCFQIRSVTVPDTAPGHGFMALLDKGELDAVMLAEVGEPAGNTTKKLFDDPYREAREYVDLTGIMPLNTVITLKRETVDRYQELPERLMRAWHAALGLYHAEMVQEKDAHHMGLRRQALLDMNVFPPLNGLSANRENIRLMIHYCYEQGLIRRLFEPEDLFEPVPEL